MNEIRYTLEENMALLTPPVLIISSFVGRGNYSIGEAYKQRCSKDVPCYHIAIEDILPPNAVHEDLHRYKWISNNLRPLLYLIYTIPIIYYLKYAREKWICKTDLSVLEKKIQTLKINSIVCISHRPAFWVSLLKSRTHLNFSVWGVLAEFGTNLGWSYIFWGSMNGFFSILPRKELKNPFPSKLQFRYSDLPYRKEFSEINNSQAAKNNLLFVAGYWGQVETNKAIILIKALLNEIPKLTIHAVCGTNESLEKSLKKHLGPNNRVNIYGKVNSLLDLMSQCSSIITKPGFSTIVEAHAASKKIFLLKGMPVAEDHNAAHAIDNFSAEWYNIELFKKWYHSS